MKKLALIVLALAVLVIAGPLAFAHQESPPKPQSTPVPAPEVFVNVHFAGANGAWWTTSFEARASAEVPITLTEKFLEDPDSREMINLGTEWTKKVFNVSPGKPEPVAFRIDAKNFFVQIYGNDDCKPGLEFWFHRGIDGNITIKLHNWTNNLLQLTFPGSSEPKPFLAMYSEYVYRTKVPKGDFDADPCGDVAWKFDK